MAHSNYLFLQSNYGWLSFQTSVDLEKVYGMKHKYIMRRIKNNDTFTYEMRLEERSE